MTRESFMKKSPTLPRFCPKLQDLMEHCFTEGNGLAISIDNQPLFEGLNTIRTHRETLEYQETLPTHCC